ncbi:MAG: hypothetical protein ACE5I1_02540 [bacterium]
MNYTLNFTYNTWLLILGCIALVALSWWIYKYTTPKVAELLRKALLWLRFISIALVLFLIFEPVLGLSWLNVEKAVVALLIDTSSSLQLKDSGKAREQYMREILNKSWLEKLSKKYTVVPFIFSDQAKELKKLEADSLKFGGDGTNIKGAIDFANENLIGKNLATMLLISDGAQNLGADPAATAFEYGVPINTLAIGSDTPEKDTWIAEVLTNEVVYANTKVPVEVVMRSTGFSGKSAQLTLQQGEKTIAVQTVQLPDDLQESKIRFDFIPQETGMHKYDLSLTAQDGEITTRNNSHTFYMNVLKSKLQIVIVAGAPDAEITFLKQVLEKDENLTVKTVVAIDRTTLLGGELPSGADLESVDCLIGVNLPQNRNPGLDRWLQNAVLEKHRPLLFIAGLVTSSNDFWRYRNFLPLASLPRVENEKEILTVPSPQGLIHPILRFRESSVENRASLEELPPLYSTFRFLKVLPNAEVLLFAKPLRGQLAGNVSRSGEPLLVAHRQGEMNTLTLFAGSLWRWHLMMQKIEPGHDLYDKLVINAVRWLVSASDARQLQVSTNKEIYRAGEEVAITAQAYFEDFTPRDNLEIAVKITNRSNVDEIILEGKGRGLYEGRFNALSDGDYTFRATAKEGEAAIGSDAGKFTVEALKIEFLQTTANLELLKNLSAKSGGQYLHADSLEQWVDTLHFEDRTLAQNRTIQLWNRWPLLAVIILTLSLEWFIRKREGMM